MTRRTVGDSKSRSRINAEPIYVLDIQLVIAIQNLPWLWNFLLLATAVEIFNPLTLVYKLALFEDQLFDLLNCLS